MPRNLNMLALAAFTCSAFLIFYGINAPIAHGATKPECSFGTQLNTLEDMRATTTLSYERRIEGELRLRKNMLTNVVDCSAKEVRSLEVVLKTVPLPNNDRQVEETVARLTQQLENAVTFYQNQKARIDTLTLQGSKRLALDILDWRTSLYAPTEEKITYFIIWIKNQNLMSTAERRFAQISNTVETLRLQESSDIAKLLETAKQDLGAAKQDNYNAQQVLTDPNAPNDSLILVKTSLEKLARAYQSFFELSEAVNIILPH